MVEELNIKDYLGECLWSEDDALPHDRERMDSAIPRITGMPYRNRNPERVLDGGDCSWEIYPDWVLCFSYPGNTAIYRRKK